MPPRLHSSFRPPLVIPAKAGIQGVAGVALITPNHSSYLRVPAAAGMDDWYENDVTRPPFVIPAPQFVIPAEAGIQGEEWVPAATGMVDSGALGTIFSELILRPTKKKGSNAERRASPKAASRKGRASPSVAPADHVLASRLRPGCLVTPAVPAYRCFLPDLAGFTDLRRTRPDHQCRPTKTESSGRRPQMSVQPRCSGLRVLGHR